MKNSLLFSILLFGASLQAQVNIDSLSLLNRDLSGIFYRTSGCEEDSLLLHGLDTGTAGNFEYRWRYYQTDNAGNKMQLLLSSPFTSGPIDEEDINQGLETIKTLDEPLVLLQLDIRDNASSDSAHTPIVIKSLPRVDTSYIQTLAGLVFTQPDKLGFDTAFPGPWVAPVAVGPYVELAHDYFDRYLLRLEEYDNLGNKIRNVALQPSLQDTLHVSMPFTVFSGFNLGVSFSDTADFFMNNTTREYYRFSFYFGAEGCGWDSVSTYFRLITPSEISMAEVEEKDLNIYPNPARSELVVQCSEDIRKATLLDLQGKPVLRNAASSGAVRFMVGDLPQGMYILRLDLNGRLVHRKIEVR